MGNFWEFCRTIRGLSYDLPISPSNGYKNRQDEDELEFLLFRFPQKAGYSDASFRSVSA
jgi:hypothetical protein